MAIAYDKLSFNSKGIFIFTHFLFLLNHIKRE